MPFVKGQIANPDGKGGVKAQFGEAMKVYRFPPAIGDLLKELLKQEGGYERVLGALGELESPGKLQKVA